MIERFSVEFTYMMENDEGKTQEVEIVSPVFKIESMVIPVPSAIKTAPPQISLQYFFLVNLPGGAFRWIQGDTARRTPVYFESAKYNS